MRQISAPDFLFTGSKKKPPVYRSFSAASDFKEAICKERGRLPARLTDTEASVFSDPEMNLDIKSWTTNIELQTHN